jgi:hypothetical protein
MQLLQALRRRLAHGPVGVLQEIDYLRFERPAVDPVSAYAVQLSQYHQIKYEKHAQPDAPSGPPMDPLWTPYLPPQVVLSGSPDPRWTPSGPPLNPSDPLVWPIVGSPTTHIVHGVLLRKLGNSEPQQRLVRCARHLRAEAHTRCGSMRRAL